MSGLDHHDIKQNGLDIRTDTEFKPGLDAGQSS